MTIKAGIIGASGYTGGELIRLLLNHPNVTITAAASRSNAHQPVSAVHRHLYKQFDLVECDVKAENFAQCDVVFLALPHGTSAALAKELVEMKVKVVDLGADFRLRDISVYQQWYQTEHGWADVLAGTVYGLPEIYRERIKGSALVANPGCYPTSVILALAPLLKNKLVQTDSIVIDSKSGITGSGKTLTQQSHFPDMNDNLAAYKLGEHRHTPEIEQELSALAQEDIMVTFNPHLVPMNRGILSTITVKAKAGFNQQMLDEVYQDFYQDELFVRVRDKNNLPNTKWVQGSNYCDVAPVYIERTGRIVVVSVIDNLVKGASGQAVQNMNLMLGLAEESGLQYHVLCP